MKLTLETTDPENKYQKKVIIEQPFDDLTIDDIIEELVKPILLAYGFHPDIVDGYFGVEDDKEI